LKELLDKMNYKGPQEKAISDKIDSIKAASRSNEQKHLSDYNPQILDSKRRPQARTKVVQDPIDVYKAYNLQALHSQKN